MKINKELIKIPAREFKNSSVASFWFSFSKSLYIGIKAWLNAPSAKNRLNKFGIFKTTTKISKTPKICSAYTSKGAETVPTSHPLKDRLQNENVNKSGTAISRLPCFRRIVQWCQTTENQNTFS